jgi:hypothetical protein
MSGAPYTTCAACGGGRSTAQDLMLAEEEAREKEGAIWLEKLFGPTNPALQLFATDGLHEQFMQDPALRVYDRKELCVACWREQEELDERKETEDEDFEDWPEDEDEDALDEEL